MKESVSGGKNEQRAVTSLGGGRGVSETMGATICDLECPVFTQSSRSQETPKHTITRQNADH